MGAHITGLLCMTLFSIKPSIYAPLSSWVPRMLDPPPDFLQIHLVIGSRPGRFYRLPWGSFRTMICRLRHLYLTQPSVRCTFFGGIPFGHWSVSR